MSLSPGSRLGQYEVVSALGAGGMGEVYRAKDSKLKREVALKVLPADVANDRERLARFQREAEVLASLNHPHIAHIHGIEESSGTIALVMELVEGEDLSQRIARGAIPIDEALPIAKQIAEALEAAHEQGIVHRDLKPANIKVREDGTVKVLDFGLAKAMESGTGSRGPGAELANSPTITSPAMTLRGVIMGTAAYMSPEQAKGRVVDKRADIWAFGCVLYEMLTRRKAFDRDDVTDTIVAVISKEPDWSQLPPDTPAPVRRLLARCLEKDARRRLRDIGDAWLEAAEPGAAPPVPTVATPARGSWQWITPLVLTALVAGALGGVMWRAQRDLPPMRWTTTRLGGPEVSLYPRVSPDGQLLAVLAVVDALTQVAVMKAGTNNWTVLTTDRTNGPADSLEWARDGSRIYFDRLTDVYNGIYSVPALGGDARLVIENASAPHPLEDGSLLMMRANSQRQQQLYRFWPGSGQVTPLPAISNHNGYQGHIQQVDDGHIVFLGRPSADAAKPDRLYEVALDSGAMTAIGPELRPADLFSVAFDRRDRSLLVAVRDRSATKVLRVPLGDARPSDTVLTFLVPPYLDVGPDGAVFAGLLERPYELLHIRPGSKAVERWASRPTFTGGGIGQTDGRYLVAERLAGASHVLIGSPGKEPTPLVDTNEDTWAPMTPLGADRVALLIGAANAPDIGIVAANTGRVLKRLKAPAIITSLAASPDGRILYATSVGSVLALPIDGGPARTLGPGDSLTIDPDSGDLIVKLDEAERFRLVRMSPVDGTTKPISITGDVRMIPEPLIAGAVRGGKMLLPVATADSWYWYVGLLDLRSGRIEKVSLDYYTDFHFVTWAADGSILGSGLGTQSSLWKFAPEPRDR